MFPSREAARGFIPGRWHARALPAQTAKAHATRADLDPDQGEGQDQAMQARKAWHAVEKRHARGTRVQTRLIRMPCWQCAARHLTPRSGVTLGDPLGVSRA